ncbi:PilW family protein [Pseudomonas sp. J452]|uniref:PilW family protein n=1 Tax=Pseudomonas sp. J452 TaxID=2898441 RepID=UPI0021AD7A3E|nr:PilW family protein [Pseudomonas sp. J452]UUY10142.1 PilW family protein [Pseudomonas sp. J452]
MNGIILTPRGRQQGLSLIELMVTLLLSSFLLLGILQLFINSNTTDRANSALARLQENGRIALDMVKRDFRRTGYQGCASPDMESLERSSRTFPLDAMGDQVEGAGTDNDTLLVRHAAPARIRLVETFPDTTIITGPGVGFTAGERYEFVLTDCEAVAIFTADVSAPSDNADPATEVEFPNKYSISNLKGFNNGPAPDLSTMATTEHTEFLRITEHQYAVRDDPTNNNRPTLYKGDDPMIADVDNFQVLYGIDSNGNEPGGTINWYNGDTLNTEDLRSQVSRLQISLVMSSPDEVADQANTQAFTIANLASNQLNAIADRRLRRAFNTVIDVRNRP